MYLAAILGLGMINGLFSGLTLIMAQFVILFSPALMLGASVVFMLSSIIVSTGTIMLAGIPAALVERVTGKPGSDLSMWVWLAATGLLSLGAAARGAGFLF
jgi:hypothetical protein